MINFFFSCKFVFHVKCLREMNEKKSRTYAVARPIQMANQKEHKGKNDSRRCERRMKERDGMERRIK